MAESFAWGVAAASSLLLGGALALRFRISTRLLGLVMAFGSGVLISALAFELVQEAVDTSAGDGGVALGLFAGSLVFFAGDLAIDRMGGADRKSSSGAGQEGGSAMGIVLGIVLDGVPESMVIGLTIVEGGAVSIAYLAAVFMSNLPEALAASTGLRAGGWTKAKVMLLWLGVTGVSGVSALLGFVLLEDASPRTVAIVLSFAGGAILTMLAETMMPEAFKHGGKLVGVFTTLGFALAFAIGALE